MQFAGFIDFLRANGFVVGLDHYARLLRVVERLDAACPPDRVKTVLCPLFATTPAQQDQFYRAFDTYFPQFRVVTPARDVDDYASSDQSPRQLRAPVRSSPWRRYGIPLFVIASVVVAAMAIVWTRRDAGPSVDARARGPIPAPPATAPAKPVVPAGALNPVAGPPPPVVSPTPWIERNALWLAIALALMPFGIVAVAEWRALARRHLLLERQRRAGPPLSWPIHIARLDGPYAEHPDVSVAARRLRTRTESDARTLDVQRTVHATILAHGLPTFRYSAQTRPPEYLILIERASRGDHQAELHRDLVATLEQEGVHVVTLSFDRDPRVCQSDDGTSVAIGELRKRYPDHRLVVLGGGDGLTDPITGRLASWVPQALTWRDRVLLTPVPTARWGAREIALAGHLLILPATVAALAALVDALASDVRLDAAAWPSAGDESIPDVTQPDFITSLRRYVGEPMLQWICACALYPEIQWSLTLSLARMPALGAGLVTEANLITLVRLPWFRAGAIPDSARRELLAEIKPPVERAARAKIVELLESNPPPEGSVASTRYELDLVVQKFALSKRERARRAELRRAAKRLPAEALTRDIALLRLADTGSGLAMVLPERLRATFFRGGIPMLGLRGGLLARLSLAFGAALLAVVAVGFASSRSANQRLERTVRAASDGVKSLASESVNLPSLDALQKLDALRAQVDTLRDIPAGATLYPAARAAYFASFDKLMFASTRSAMLATLRGLPGAPRPSDSYGDSYDLLKAYVITTAHPEKSTPEFLTPALMSRWLGGRDIDSARAQLGYRQFEMYARELRRTNPFSDTVDPAAVAKGRAFLRQFAGSERVYRFVLAEASKANAPVDFNSKVPGSSAYVVAPYVVAGAFTKGGAAFVLSGLKSVDRFVSGEAWVVGEDAGRVDKAKVVADLQARYAADYVEAWRRFLASAYVARYTSVKDAAAKLAVLGGSQSPLLALLSLASENTPPKSAPYLSALRALQSSIDTTANASAEQVASQASSKMTAARAAARQVAAGLTNTQGQTHVVVEELMDAPVANLELFFRDWADIGATIVEYARAIGSRDLNELRRAYPGMTSDQARGWGQFFTAIESVTATVTMEGLTVLGDSADARIGGEYAYRSAVGVNRRQSVNFVAAFKKEGGAWKLMSVK